MWTTEAPGPGRPPQLPGEPNQSLEAVGGNLDPESGPLEPSHIVLEFSTNMLRIRGGGRVSLRKSYFFPSS